MAAPKPERQALLINQGNAYRRGIAASLQQIAELELLQQHWQQADKLLQRALKIHLWTLNKADTIKVLHKLVQSNREMGNDTVAEQYNQQIEKLSDMANRL